VANVFTSNDKNPIYVEHTHLSYPTKLCSSAQDVKDNDDSATVVASNVSYGSTHSYKACALTHILNQSEFSGVTFCLNIKDAIADSGEMQIFVMEGIPAINKHRMTQLLKVALANGRQVMSTHMSDIYIEGLPTILTGNIIPNLSITSLFGIRALTDAGCYVAFDSEKCTVRYNGKTIISGGKDLATDLWTLPLGSNGMTSHYVQNTILPVDPAFTNAHANLSTQIAFFTHTVQTKGNSIHFAHQCICSPKISTLLKAIQCRYLKGCPNLTAKGVSKYLNPSPATAKGHMKCPRKGIRSTRPKRCRTTATNVTTAKLPIIENDDDDDDDDLSHFSPQGGYPHSNTNVIDDNDGSTKDANLFCFAVFADKQTETLYNDLTGAFPFILLEGNVCFLIVYHYESNTILALPILGFINNVIFTAYKQQYELLESKGFVIKFNVMDNQASNVIRQYLTPKQCDLMLVDQTTTKWMQPNAPYRCSKTILSAHSQPQTANFLSNFGVALPHTWRPCSTCYDCCELIPQSQLVKC
jgi:hypothetical protein